MDTNLYKVSKVCWAVTSPIDEYPQVFKNPDDAAEYLLAIGIQDSHIDLALVDMLIRGSTRANFGVDGTFIFSDEANVNGKLGTA